MSNIEKENSGSEATPEQEKLGDELKQMVENLQKEEGKEAVHKPKRKTSAKKSVEFQIGGEDPFAKEHRIYQEKQKGWEKEQKDLEEQQKKTTTLWLEKFNQFKGLPEGEEKEKLWEELMVEYK